IRDRLVTGVQTCALPISSTLTPSRRVAFATVARPTRQDLPRTTSGPSRPSTKQPALTYTGGRSVPAVTLESGAIFARLAARRRRDRKSGVEGKGVERRCR